MIIFHCAAGYFLIAVISMVGIFFFFLVLQLIPSLVPCISLLCYQPEAPAICFLIFFFLSHSTPKHLKIYFHIVAILYHSNKIPSVLSAQ